MYLYYLPSGTSLPSSSQPTCNDCAKRLMKTFSNYATLPDMPISSTYLDASEVVGRSCGEDFAPVVQAVGKAKSGSARSQAGIRGVLLMSVILGLLACV